MGKVPKQKRHIGTHRSAGAFTAAESLAGKAVNDGMDVEMGTENKIVPEVVKSGNSKQRHAALAKGSRRASVVQQRVGVHEGAISVKERRSTLAASAAAVDPSLGLPLSRGQKKRLARKASIQIKKHLGPNMLEKADAIKQGALGDLASLSSSLQAAEAAAKARKGSVGMKMTKNNRKRLLISESAQLQAVLSHASFQANPLATIHQHLENSVKS